MRCAVMPCARWAGKVIQVNHGPMAKEAFLIRLRFRKFDRHDKKREA